MTSYSDKHSWANVMVLQWLRVEDSQREMRICEINTGTYLLDSRAYFEFEKLSFHSLFQEIL